MKFFLLVFACLLSFLNAEQIEKKHQFSVETKNENILVSCDDVKLGEDILMFAENHYQKVMKDYQIKFSKKIDVYVYTNNEIFRKSLGKEKFDDHFICQWNFDEKSVRLISPDNCGSIHKPSRVYLALAQAISRFAIEKKYGKMPVWLLNSLCLKDISYLKNAKTIIDFYQKRLVECINRDEFLTLTDLANCPSFGDTQMSFAQSTNRKKTMAFTLAFLDFVTDNWGDEKLEEFMKKPFSVTSVFQMSEKDLNLEFSNYLKEKYLSE
jgi:hypothetical protein